MGEMENQVGGPETQAEGSQSENVTEEQAELSLDEYKSRLTQLEKTNARILEEHKRDKQRLKKYMSEKDELEQKRLKEAGQFEDLYHKQRETTEQWQDRYSTLEKRALGKDLDMQMARHASDLAVSSKLLRVALEDYEQVQVDSETLEWQGVKEAIADLREKQPSLFRPSKKAPQFDKRASEGADSDVRTGFEAELAQAKTQKQLDMVYQKYGKEAGRPLY